MGDSAVGKWASGTSCEFCGLQVRDACPLTSRIDGPVLSQTDLYLLNTELQLHPILQGSNPSFHLLFNLVTGSWRF